MTIERDIISSLPYEISELILSLLDPQSLCRASQVCRQWQSLISDRIWRVQLQRHMDLVLEVPDFAKLPPKIHFLIMKHWYRIHSNINNGIYQETQLDVLGFTSSSYCEETRTLAFGCFDGDDQSVHVYKRYDQQFEFIFDTHYSFSKSWCSGCESYHGQIEIVDICVDKEKVLAYCSDHKIYIDYIDNKMLQIKLNLHQFIPDITNRFMHHMISTGNLIGMIWEHDDDGSQQAVVLNILTGKIEMFGDQASIQIFTAQLTSDNSLVKVRAATEQTHVYTVNSTINQPKSDALRKLLSQSLIALTTDGGCFVVTQTEDRQGFDVQEFVQIYNFADLPILRPLKLEKEPMFDSSNIESTPFDSYGEEYGDYCQNFYSSLEVITYDDVVLIRDFDI